MVCKERNCTGCMACVAACPKQAITIRDSISHLDAIIDENLCIHCDRCRNICQQNNPLEKSTPLFWMQGWAIDKKIRAAAASGGVATAFMYSFIKNGGVVVSCELKEGEFTYSSSSDPSDISRYVGSKYVKSDPLSAYSIVETELKKGRNVLFIGLPCHVAGIKKYIGTKNADNLYLVDLICHGTPSLKLLQLFLQENGIDIRHINRINFRKKGTFQVSSKEIQLVPVSVVDRYTMGFLSGLFYTDNCYTCTYATSERVSDLTIGDSWGSDLIDEVARGISLILCNSQKGKTLLNSTELELFDVDSKKAIESNGQLDHPSVMPPEREHFFRTLRRKNSFSRAVFAAYPKHCIKQSIKAFLIRSRLLKPRGR